ncbi:putative normal mitochondrial morphology protein [Thermochaetoides thermophila DSM 1495]|uniref:Putative normal mitochondrial morphology protein n=1 Tax=Chaetomium thermophilum (strain DSM 1495 / CBS 144.50 / IMI 039719) TaxID=759272 RepID=G0SFE2_CHATD|nr:putative normal mitochondrial morphology protein [Thermochaetoides thermophila DSM 1495]EGS18158.1 putative normal mitochondrial morphology protein [Thermochaetoides thermophila DSM 1495]
MVLTHTTNHSYSHPFPAVTLAYFLRYCSPHLNPFASHVISSDTLSCYVDPETGRLHTTRIHLKKSRLPPAVMKLLPASLTGGAADKASYILETSVVDMREGWLASESRNLNYVGILSVVERQLYTVPKTFSASTESTDVETKVVFRSRLGERIRDRLGQVQAQAHAEAEAAGSAGGWFARLGAKGIQRSIESLASTKTLDQLGKSREGMRIVLERLRQTGINRVLELRKMARERAFDGAAA